MAWSKNANPEEVKAYNRLYYLKKIKKKREQEKQNYVKECPICHAKFKPERKNQKYCCDACKKLAEKIRGMLYRQTEEYKEKIKEYRKTDKFKETQKNYRQSEKYKEYKREYQKQYYRTQKGKEVAEKYRQTDKYKATIKRYQDKKKEENNLEH